MVSPSSVSLGFLVFLSFLRSADYYLSERVSSVVLSTISKPFLGCWHWTVAPLSHHLRSALEFLSSTMSDSDLHADSDVQELPSLSGVSRGAISRSKELDEILKVGFGMQTIDLIVE